MFKFTVMPYPQQNRQAEIKINVEVRVGCSLMTLVKKKRKMERHGIRGEKGWRKRAECFSCD